MSNPENKTAGKVNSAGSLRKNYRIATRYVREDITAFISDLGFFSFGKVICVELKDITSKGVLIATSQKLSNNQKVTLTLQFRAGKSFVIKATVVRVSISPGNNEYGIKFDRYHNDLGDYLLETQNKLVFK